MNEQNHLTAIIRDEEAAVVVNAIDRRLAEIEAMPDGPLRARLCAAAFLTGGYQLMAGLEGDAETVRQLRRIADMLDAAGHPKC